MAADPTINIGYPTGGTGPSDNAKSMGVKEDQLIDFPGSPTGFAAVKEGRTGGGASPALAVPRHACVLKPGLSKLSGTIRSGSGYGPPSRPGTRDGRCQAETGR